jgi:nucleotide-binding universal stress UspA family protein
MRTHGRAGLARAVLGSVAERILTLSPVPLLLLRPGAQHMTQIRSVLVPVDGSPGGSLALGAAVGLAEASGASLRLLEVVVLILTYIYGAYALNGATYVDPAWDEDARLSAQTYVDGLATRIVAVWRSKPKSASPRQSLLRSPTPRKSVVSISLS